jgi:hypothetical protein
MMTMILGLCAGACACEELTNAIEVESTNAAADDSSNPKRRFADVML